MFEVLPEPSATTHKHPQTTWATESSFRSWGLSVVVLCWTFMTGAASNHTATLMARPCRIALE